MRGEIWFTACLSSEPQAAIKRYMIALSDAIRTKFIGEIVFEVHAIW